MVLKIHGGRFLKHQQACKESLDSEKSFLAQYGVCNQHLNLPLKPIELAWDLHFVYKILNSFLFSANFAGGICHSFILVIISAYN